MKKIFPILMMIGIAVTSCADWMDNEDILPQPDSVTLSRHELTMLVGDTCRLNAIFSPEDYAEQSLMWISTVDSIVHLDANKLTAEHEGNCRVIATSTMGALSDTCYVHVLPAWGKVMPDRFDMVVYATLPYGTGEGQVEAAADDVEVGAFCNGELRGRSEFREHFGVQYTALRIYSPVLSMEGFEIPITFRLHHKRDGWVEEYPDTIYFDGEAHGTLSNLYPLRLTK